MQKRITQFIVKWGLITLKKYLNGKKLNLYNLEEGVFNMFLPIQREIFETAASEINQNDSSTQKKCPQCQSKLLPKGVQKKNSSVDLIRSI